MKDGLDTDLGNYAGGLSGGQAQRLGLAQALIYKPKLLILDKCLTAVDKSIAKEIRNNLPAIDDLTIIEVLQHTLDIPNVKVLEF